MRTAKLLGAVSPVAMMIAASLATPVQAQTQARAQTAPAVEEIGEVVVTARRREERLRDVPIAASAFDAQTIAERGGVNTVQDLVQNAPGVRFFNTSSQLNSEISIRASGTARGTNADPSVGLYRNGVFVGGGYLGGRNFTKLDLFDLGRAEILRGTQGALYGRDAVGGSVNMVSAKPTFKQEGSVKAGYAFDTEGKTLQAVVNQPINQFLAVRLGADYVDQDKGFFYNPNNKVYFDQNHGLGLRAQVRLNKGPLDATWLSENQVATIPAVAFRVYIRAGATAQFPVAYVQPEYSYPWNFAPLAKQNVTSHILSVDYDLGFATLSSTSAYRQRKSSFAFDQDGIDPAELAALNAVGDNKGADVFLAARNADNTKTWSQDLHLTGAKTGRFSWLLGVEIFDQKTDYLITTGRTPSAANGQSPGVETIGRQDFKSVAGYGSAGVDLSQALNVTLELRYTSDSKSIDSNRFDRRTGAQSGGAAFILKDKVSPENLAYTLVAAYKFPNRWLGYAKVGTGYRAGGFNYNLGDPRQPIPIPSSYDNEISTTYEVGTKGNIMPGVFATAAAYKTRVKDFIAGGNNGCAAGSACPVASTPFLFNGGNAESWGLEAEINTSLSLAGGRLRVGLGGSRQGGKVVKGLYEDATLPQVPDWTASGSLNYRKPLQPDITLFGNVNYQAAWGGVSELTPKGTAFYNPAAVGPFNAPMHDFQLVDLRAGLEIGKVQLAAYARNAFNKKYVIYEAITTQRLNVPRLVGVDVTYRW